MITVYFAMRSYFFEIRTESKTNPVIRLHSHAFPDWIATHPFKIESFPKSTPVVYTFVGDEENQHIICYGRIKIDCLV